MPIPMPSSRITNARTRGDMSPPGGNRAEHATGPRGMPRESEDAADVEREVEAGRVLGRVLVLLEAAAAGRAHAHAARQTDVGEPLALDEQVGRVQVGSDERGRGRGVV